MTGNIGRKIELNPLKNGEIGEDGKTNRGMIWLSYSCSWGREKNNVNKAHRIFNAKPLPFLTTFQTTF